MPILFGEKQDNESIKVTMISYTPRVSTTPKDGVEVNSVLEGEGQLYVNPETGEQWLELEEVEEETEESSPQEETLEQKVDRMLALLEGGGAGEMGS